MTITIERMQKLVDEGLAVSKYDIERKLTTFKYHNRVFYQNRWNESEDLLECRGIVFDDEGLIAQRPFKKIFNYGENGMGNDIPKDKEVIAVRKVNGFLAAASWHADDLLVSTTGTTTSDFAKLAESWLWKYDTMFKTFPDYTFLFEIVDSSDPHIVHEEAGPYLLGMRHKRTGQLIGFPACEVIIGKQFDVRTPEWFVVTMGQVLELNRTTRDIEGFVLYDVETNGMLLKTKTPHYLSKKALMRMGRGKVHQMYHDPDTFRERLDEEFYSLFHHILIHYSYDDWLGMSEQDRRKAIEDYFYDEE